jgi:transposase
MMSDIYSRKDGADKDLGTNVHKHAAQLCVLDDEDTVVFDRRIRTTRARLTEASRDRPPARLLLEASPESEWVAQLLQDLGHAVIVADPNFAAVTALARRLAGILFALWRDGTTFDARHVVRPTAPTCTAA